MERWSVEKLKSWQTKLDVGVAPVEFSFLCERVPLCALPRRAGLATPDAMVGGAGNKRKLVGQQGTTLAHHNVSSGATPGTVALYTGYNGVPIGWVTMGELTAPLLLVSYKWPICPDGSAVVQ